MQDVPINLTTIILAILVALPGILTFIQQRRNHKLMNSRLDELLTAEKAKSKAEGKAEEAAEEKGRTVKES